MASRYSSSEIFDKRSAQIQFDEWVTSDEPPDFALHARRAAAVAIQEELTDTQRRYLTMFLGGASIPQIAETYGVNKSTVSRTITAARRKLRKVLRYAAPQLLNAKFEPRNRRR